MTEKQILINRGQNLSDILPNKEIPTNTILNKTLTGCGATYGEIVHAARNSIIIEPNVPVILGKKAEHPFLFAVYEGITKENVKAFLSGEEDGFRKIITTPEGFDKKVLPAMLETNTPIYEDYFLLLDECEKTIQDVGYRGDIYLPVEDFFKFKNKAMVSATPILPSDPRFKEQNFELLRVVPTYDYRQPLTLCITNNTIHVLRKLLSRLKDETVCIFINSTDTILELIQTFGLEEHSKVFCSDKSVRKLKQQNFTAVSDQLTELAKINFFTSRFYSAVDIKLDYKPHVIILTDVFHAPYSIIDPQTEVVQAIGRFRNGIEKAYHITNTCDRLPCVSRDKLFHTLECQEKVYTQIQGLPIEGAIELQARAQALEGMDYKRFVTRTGNRNWFMWDNAWTDARLNTIYQYSTTLEEEYKKAPFLLDVYTANYDITDEDRLRRTQAQIKGTTELWREVVGQVNRILQQNPNAEQMFLNEQLGCAFGEIIEATTILGKERIEQLGYNRRKIKAALGNVAENRLMTSEKMRQAVYARYNTGDVVICSEILNFLRELITNNGIPFKSRLDKQVVKLFFEIDDDKVRVKGNKAYLLGKKMFEI